MPGQAVILAEGQTGAGGHLERHEAGVPVATICALGPSMNKRWILVCVRAETVLKGGTWGGIWLSGKEVFLLMKRDGELRYRDRDGPGLRGW